MIKTMDELKTVLPSAEEKDKEEDVFDCEREDEACHEDEEQEEPGSTEGEEEVEEETPQAADKIEESSKPRDKKQTVAFNLNNEVVKMRKEVKRVRALIIRKLTRRIVALKKKKGKDIEIESNQRRAARLLEEIHAMKVLSPDLVTKTALQKNLNLNQVCKNPKSTISDRAVARIATYPQFHKKIEGINAALKAFKEEWMKTGGKEKVRAKQKEKKKEELTVEKRVITDSVKVQCSAKDLKDAAVAIPETERSEENRACDTAAGQKKEIPVIKNVKQSPVKRSDEKKIGINDCPGDTAEKKPDPNIEFKVLQQKKEEEESDLEPSDDEEEKEYFDDSTEERFHRQSSQSEGSDDDDFFVGKVSKLKKKMKQSKGDGKREVKGDPSELDVNESKPKSKPSQFQTVFCSTLSASGTDKGAGRGRGGGSFRGHETLKGVNHPKNKQPTFQKQRKGGERNSGPMFKQPQFKGRHPESQLMGGRGFGRGRGEATKPKVSSEALHPSWEASKKRKEQQGQILAFQGKKIKFDDDD